MKVLQVIGCIVVTSSLLTACSLLDPGEKGETTGEDKGPVPVSDRADIEGAAVQIVARGSFVDPEVGQVLNAAGSGSGFIIDPSGMAVTNNHVVTGSALLEVYVGGEDEPRNAKVLGVSECSDLAVIDIDGEGYPFFEWRKGEIDAGLDVYAAGFPLGDPEFTLTRGIVSKAEASGESVWASVDSVIEHDANINPGNSGGPLLDDKNRVVGVNYASDPEANQHFAITPGEGLEIISELSDGQDVTSIGINGQAVLSEDETLSGIWVSSVESGSPADEAGVRGGDILTKLEGLVLATDGTMSDYCDVLRSRDRKDTMNIEVLRFETGEVLEGQLNGRKLKTSTTLAPEVTEEVPEESAAEGYSGFTTVTDNSESLKMEVPNEWTDINGNNWEFEGEAVGPGLNASADLQAYNDTWEEPGAFLGASVSLAQSYTVDQMLDAFDYSRDCEKEGRFDYADELYSGKYDFWKNCGPENTSFVILSTMPDDQSYITMIQILIKSEADLEAMERILTTFEVTGAA